MKTARSENGRHEPAKAGVSCPSSVARCRQNRPDAICSLFQPIPALLSTFYLLLSGPLPQRTPHSQRPKAVF